MKAITAHNFHRVPASDLIESVLYDIDRCLKAGVKFNMSSYGSKLDNGNCMACLGGMALLGFEPRITPDVVQKIGHYVCKAGSTVNGETKKYWLARMMDGLRTCMFVNFEEGFENIYRSSIPGPAYDELRLFFKSHYGFYGRMHTEDVTKLQKFIMEVVEIL